MEYIKLLLPLAPLLPATVAIALFMETYKKKFRKDRAKPVEIYWVAVFVSMGVAVSCFLGFDLPGGNWAVGLYFFGIYTCQFYINMKGIKFVIRLIAKQKKIDLEGYLDD